MMFILKDIKRLPNFYKPRSQAKHTRLIRENPSDSVALKRVIIVKWLTAAGA